MELLYLDSPVDCSGRSGGDTNTSALARKIPEEIPREIVNRATKTLGNMDETANGQLK